MRSSSGAPRRLRFRRVERIRLYSITAIVEAEDAEDAEAVHVAIEKAICPHPIDVPDQKCPRGWITTQRELDDREAAIWREPDALNR